MESKRIGSIASGGSSEVVVSTFTGKDEKERVDIRLFITATTKEDGYTGPTKKGVTVPTERLDNLIELLQKAKS